VGLSLLGLAGFLCVYARARGSGRTITQAQVDRLRRLPPAAVAEFYRTFTSSMENEVAEYPAYDQRKHDLRYQLVTEAALAHLSAGDTLLDVGCASGIVLDRASDGLRLRRIGFDLSPFGLNQRLNRPDPPVLAVGSVEHLPLPDAAVDVVLFSEVIEHLVDAYVGYAEISRVLRPGGIVVLTTNNASEMPEVSPLVDPLTWIERIIGRRLPAVLSARILTWDEPISRDIDPLTPEGRTHVPHIHFAAAELRELAADAGLVTIASGSFEFPAPQSALAERLRRLTASHPQLGHVLSDALEGVAATVPGISGMGTHHLIVLRKVGDPLPRPRRPWWPAALAAEPVEP
jgi:SAM-dependent methyltransferase